jgi:hypothetical protein
MPDDTGTTIVRLAGNVALAATNSIEGNAQARQALEAPQAPDGDGGSRQLATPSSTAVRRTLSAKYGRAPTTRVSCTVLASWTKGCLTVRWMCVCWYRTVIYIIPAALSVSHSRTPSPEPMRVNLTRGVVLMNLSRVRAAAFWSEYRHRRGRQPVWLHAGLAGLGSGAAEALVDDCRVQVQVRTAWRVLFCVQRSGVFAAVSPVGDLQVCVLLSRSVPVGATLGLFFAHRLADLFERLAHRYSVQKVDGAAATAFILLVFYIIRPR